MIRIYGKWCTDVLIMFIMNIIVIVIIASCSSRSNNEIFKYSDTDIPEMFPLKALIVDDAKQGQGIYIGGSLDRSSAKCVIFFTSDSDSDSVFKQLDEQLVSAKFRMIEDEKIPNNSDDFENKNARTALYIWNNKQIKYMLAIYYWDFLSLTPEQWSVRTKSDVKGYRISIYEEYQQ